MGLWDRLRLAGSVLLSGPVAAGGQWSNTLANALWQNATGGEGRGPVVTEHTALNLAAVWQAVRIISGSVAVLPLHVYEKDANGGRREVPGDPVADPGPTLAADPFPEGTAVDFWETILAHALTWGNGYAEIQENGRGEAVGLYPIEPYRVRPRRGGGGEFHYECRDPSGNWVRMHPSRLFHIKGLGFDGLSGYSPITLARRSLGLAASAEIAGEAFYGDGMRPAGVMEFPGSLQDLQKANVEEGLSRKHGGAARFGKALVLYGGITWKQTTIPPDDAQFLETRQFQVEEVARWFNLPPHLLRDLRRATFSNIEHQGQDFVTYTLIYWLTKITQEFDRKILNRRASGRYAEHTLDALLKGDTLSRYRAYATGRQWGFLSVNDIRRRENMTPVDGGDVYLTPVNMTADPAGVADDPPEPARSPDPGQSGGE